MRFAFIALPTLTVLLIALGIQVPVPHRATAGLNAKTASVFSSVEGQNPASNTPMRLGAASNFSQGWNEAVFGAALALPIANWRDSLRWADIEKVEGQYVFNTPMTKYPARLTERNARLTLTLNWGNPLYDTGHTPHSPAALAAFSRFVAELVRRYPAIDTLEIGNEINGNNFVNGPVRDTNLAGRRAYHLAMVKSAAEGVRQAARSVRVIGGSVHSLPAGFLWPLLESRDAAFLEGLAIHPYTTPIDQLPAQVGVLRRHPAARDKPLYITELGSRDPRTAPDELVRAYATLSSLGAKELNWYPLNERGDGFVPLLRRNGEITDAGRAYRFAIDHFTAFRGVDRSPDRFTFIHEFGPRTWVLWGAPRAVRIDNAKVSAFSATGKRLGAQDLMMDETRVIVLQGREPLALGGNVRLDCTALIADSLYGFTYPAPGAALASTGFTLYSRKAGSLLPLETLPGQQVEGVPWTPYLGRQGYALPRVSADLALPSPGEDAVVMEYRVSHGGSLQVLGEFTAATAGARGADISFSIDGRQITQPQRSSGYVIDRQLQVRPGQKLAFAIRWNESARDSATKYRVRLFARSSCPGAVAVGRTDGT